MSLLNKTRKTTVAERYKMCRSACSKARGLMFTDEATVKHNALVFEFNRPMRQALHMFFVFYPIDVLFLDETKRVVEMKERFRPFTVYNSREKSKYVIELPASVIRKSKTRIGDELAWR